MTRYLISSPVDDRPFQPERARVIVTAPRKPRSVWAQTATDRLAHVTGPESLREQLAREEPAAVERHAPPCVTKSIAAGLQLSAVDTRCHGCGQFPPHAADCVAATRCHGCGIALDPKKRGGYDVTTKRAYCWSCAR